MPVRFVCPECRRVLSVTRRKIGYEVACPKCLALVTVPGEPVPVKTTESEPAPEEEVELPTAAALAFFDDLPDLAIRQRPIPVSSTTEDGLDTDSIIDDHVLISRSAIYLQAVLLLVVAATAFGLGYWLGGVDARSRAEKPPAAATPSDAVTPETS
jgi:hypothetical protein